MAKVKLNLTLEAETKEYLKILAVKKNTTVSNLIEQYVNELKVKNEK